MSSDEYLPWLEAVLNTVVDGVITINQRGIIQSFNRSAERIFGYRSHEVIGQNVKMLMPEPYHGGHDSYLSNYQQTGIKKIIGQGREVEALRKDGSVFPMELGVSEMDIPGESMFVGTIRDISDRKLAELALRDSEAKIQAVVDNTVDGLITIDGKGLVETFNKACEAIFGYKSSEVVGQNVNMLMPSPYHEEHDGYLRSYHQTGVKKIIGLGREVKGKRKDGSTFPLDLSVSEVEIQGRRIFSGIVRDISERKKAEEELMQANTELEEFAYRTSHDLRSPLVSSISLLDMVAADVRNGEVERGLESIAHIRQSLRQLELLVQDILVLTKAKHGGSANERIDLVKVFDDAISKFQHMDNFERLDIQQDFRFSEAIHADTSRIALVVENLLSNAIKYQDLNQQNSYIRISTYEDDAQFVLEVSDNGLGVPSKQQPNLFQMFKRFHPRISFGSGLGLYMMKKSADILGGKIFFEDSQPGSIFGLKLPVDSVRNL